MKRDPFSPLAGLDQRLFQERAEPPAVAKALEPTSARARARGGEGASEQGSEASLARVNEPMGAETSAQPPASSPGDTMARVNEATRTRASTLTGQLREARAERRHSHDLYLDQVRWINRLKVDLNEEYGADITGNQIVQLAVDLLRTEFELNGQQSHLIRVLIQGHELRLTAPKKERGR